MLFTNLAALLIGFGMMAQAIVVPQLLQMPTATGYGLGQTILEAGLWMAPGGLMMLVFAPVSAKLMTTLGARITLFVGALVTGCGYIVAVFLMDAPWQLMLASIVASAGVGIGYAAMPTLIMDNVPVEEAGSSVGLNGLMRSVGTTIAGAVMAVILTSKTMQLAPGVTIPDHDAFKICFIVGASAAISGALIALLVPRQRLRALAREAAASAAADKELAPRPPDPVSAARQRRWTPGCRGRALRRAASWPAAHGRCCRPGRAGVRRSRVRPCRVRS